MKTVRHFTGHLLSIFAMIRSAIEIALATAASNAGDGRPSQLARCRATKMLAAISRTRFRPSSIWGSLPVSPCIRHGTIHVNVVSGERGEGAAEREERGRSPKAGRNRAVVLRLLDDDYLGSRLTGQKYEVTGKRPYQT